MWNVTNTLRSYQWKDKEKIILSVFQYHTSICLSPYKSKPNDFFFFFQKKKIFYGTNMYKYYICGKDQFSEILDCKLL